MDKSLLSQKVTGDVQPRHLGPLLDRVRPNAQDKGTGILRLLREEFSVVELELSVHSNRSSRRSVCPE